MLLPDREISDPNRRCDFQAEEGLRGADDSEGEARFLGEFRHAVRILSHWVTVSSKRLSSFIISYYS